MSAHRLLRSRRLQDVRRVSEYVYEPIPTGEYIRRLELNPGQGPITCQMRVIPLQHAFESYDAISYCWGDPKNTTDILVDSRRIAITVNLHDALHRFRDESGSEPRFLWADAICINQKNKDEQSHQVQMMGKIYQYARCTPVWLGVDDQNIAKDSFTFIKETLKACRELLTIYDSLALIPKPMPDNPFCQDVERWEMVRILVNLPWFNRVWVKQEVGLATHSIFMLGNEAMDVKDLVDVALFSFERGDLFPLFHMCLYDVRDTFIEIWSSYGNSQSWNGLSDTLTSSILQKEGESSFLKVLGMGRQFLATDPRDYVYAFVGHPTALDHKTHDPLVKVDYNRNELDVYYDTACALLNARPSDLTYLLSCADADHRTLDQDYPSWIPRWNRAKIVSSFGYPGECPDGDFPDVKFTLLGDRSLRLSGVVFDEITWTSAPMGMPDFATNGLPRKVRRLPAVAYLSRHFLRKYPVPERLWRKIRQHNLGSRYGDGRQDAFFITMVAGRGNREKEIIQHRADFRAYCLTIDASIPGTASEKQTEYAQNGEAWRVERDIRWAAPSRRFFSTKSGYFGLSHMLIRRGDACCVFKGAKVPFIIRQIRNLSRYKLIGDAYIHGILAGRMLEKEAESLKDIILQ